MHAKIKVFSFILVLLFIGINSYGADELKLIMPEADSFKERHKPFLYSEAYKKKNLIGYCFNTRDVSPEDKGYSGQIEILVAIDRDIKILNLKILSHNESPDYASGIKEPPFLNQFKGKSANDKFIVGEDIDGITGATISSKAVAGILKHSLDKMQGFISGKLDKKKSRIESLEKAGLVPREAKYYRVIE